MTKCANCGNLNAIESNFCRFCGTRFIGVQPAVQSPFDYSAPRPYSWKTDEFQTQNQSRPTQQEEELNKHFGQANSNYGAAPLAYQQPHHLSQPYNCPRCMTRMLPRVEKRISTAGWVVFTALLVFFFPLFWIGLLIKEDVRVCPNCMSKVG